MTKHCHWIPERKRDLVEILTGLWPNDQAKFKRSQKRQLYAIFFHYWFTQGCHGCYE